MTEINNSDDILEKIRKLLLKFEEEKLFDLGPPLYDYLFEATMIHSKINKKTTISDIAYIIYDTLYFNYCSHSMNINGDIWKLTEQEVKEMIGVPENYYTIAIEIKDLY